MPTLPVRRLTDHLRLSVGEYLQTMTNYFRVPGFVASGMAWTLAIEILFYVGIFATLQLLKRWPHLAG